MRCRVKKRYIYLGITLICAALLLVYEIVGFKAIFGEADKAVEDLVSMTLTRLLGGFAFIAVLLNTGYRVLVPFRKPFLRSLLISLPAFAVVINNLPIIPLISGRAYIDSPVWKIILLLAECLAVAFFEETAFRGVVFLGFAEKRRGSIKGLFISIILSSAVFGAVHLLNLFTSSPLSVLLQIGYSFLIGAMCSVVLIRTADLWLCVILHAIFNFAGAVVPTCGGGIVWDAPTVAITAILAVLVTVYMVVLFVKTPVGITAAIYGKQSDGADVSSVDENI